MQRKSFGAMPCPIARSLERVGEWWSILILRDAFAGMTRFEEFRESLGIAPNMLTRRLNALVEAGLLERQRYSERPPPASTVVRKRCARRSQGERGSHQHMGGDVSAAALTPPTSRPTSGSKPPAIPRGSGSAYGECVEIGRPSCGSGQWQYCGSA